MIFYEFSGLRVLFEQCKTIENVPQEQLTAVQNKYET